MELGLTTVDITPHDFSHISLGGYGRMIRCKGVKEPIEARILVLRDPSQPLPSDIQLLIINIDNPGACYAVIQMIKRRFWEKYQIPPDRIYIYGTHNHYSPDLSGLMPSPIFPRVLSPTAVELHYVHFLIAKILIAFPKALQTVPIQVGIYQDVYPDNDLINRRVHKPHLRIIHPKRTIFAFRDAHEKIRALIMILPMHDTLISPRDILIARGQTGSFCHAITTLTQNQDVPAIGFYFQGPAGNVGPIHNQTLLKLAQEDVHFKFSDRYQYAEAWGKYQAQHCLKIAQTLAYQPVELSLINKTIMIPIIYYNDVRIKGWFLRYAFYAVKRLIAIPFLRLMRYGRYFFLCMTREPPKDKPKTLQFLPKHFKTEISVINLNNFLILNCPGEPFVQMGQRMEKNARLVSPSIRGAAVAEICNDCLGYLYDDIHTITLQNGYEPTMGITNLAGITIRKWMKFLSGEIK